MASDARKAEWGREIAEQSDPRLPVIQQAIARSLCGSTSTLPKPWRSAARWGTRPAKRMRDVKRDTFA